MKYKNFEKFLEEKGLADEIGKTDKSPSIAKIEKGLGDVGEKEEKIKSSLTRDKGLSDIPVVNTKDQSIPKEDTNLDDLYKNSDRIAPITKKGGFDTFVDRKEEKKWDSDSEVLVAGEPKDGLGYDHTKNDKLSKSELIGNVKNVASSRLKTEDFINETKDLSPSNFIKKISECGCDREALPTVTDLYGNQYTPDPNQVIEYIAALTNNNPKFLSKLIREIKRYENGFTNLMDESSGHPEYFNVIANNMSKPDGQGRGYCKNIVKSMNDLYMTDLDRYVYENTNEEVIPKKDIDIEDGGEIDTESSPVNPNSNSNSNSNSNEQPQDNPVEMGFDSGVQKPKSPSARLKGDTAHKNMIQEMGSYPHMHGEMSNYCTNGNC